MALTEEEKRVVNLIDEKELVDLAVAMGNIAAPSGQEQPMADFVLQWLRDNGFERSFQQAICDGRSNTIGILNGRGGGKSLIFNSHMDSEQGMPMRLDEPPIAWLSSSRDAGRSNRMTVCGEPPPCDTWTGAAGPA